MGRPGAAIGAACDSAVSIRASWMSGRSSFAEKLSRVQLTCTAPLARSPMRTMNMPGRTKTTFSVPNGPDLPGHEPRPEPAASIAAGDLDDVFAPEVHELTAEQCHQLQVAH